MSKILSLLSQNKTMQNRGLRLGFSVSMKKKRLSFSEDFCIGLFVSEPCGWFVAGFLLPITHPPRHLFPLWRRLAMKSRKGVWVKQLAWNEQGRPHQRWDDPLAPFAAWQGHTVHKGTGTWSLQGGGAAKRRAVSSHLPNLLLAL